ncbi:hypothetical protein Ocin01_17491 [Orchesella cincta]|uniref:F-box domain-containing protein n=1 Tax=Orchesella cincta TaxID=48709 RepID=A0A1D2M885_ORCCI|nr:hypothetical protein Ocin01_17491 [Orchesella cincta]
MEQVKISSRKRKMDSELDFESEGNQNEALIQPQANNPCETESEPHKPHPLLDVDLALVNVLSYLEIDELKAANLVCKTWSSQVTKLMIKKGTFLFTSSSAKRFLYKSSVDALSPFEARFMEALSV